MTSTFSPPRATDDAAEYGGPLSRRVFQARNADIAGFHSDRGVELLVIRFELDSVCF